MTNNTNNQDNETVFDFSLNLPEASFGSMQDLNDVFGSNSLDRLF